MKTGLLALAEYSNKYKVSVSTLRRRIKSGDISYEFESGKYWLEDKPLKQERPASLPGSENKKTIVKGSNQNIDSHESFKINIAEKPSAAHFQESNNSILKSANDLIQELKGAYVLILQEKEEQILGLREEVADLKTLVKILESENEKLKKESSFSESNIEWSLEDESIQDSFKDTMSDD